MTSDKIYTEPSILHNPSRVIKFDHGQIERPTLLLKTRSGEFIGQLKYFNFKASLTADQPSEISFDVYKYVDGEECKFWNRIRDLAIVDYKDYGLFIASVSSDEDDAVVKTCVCTSLESELGQKPLRNFHVNDEEAMTNTISLDMDEDGNYVPMVLYNKSHPEHSLIDRVLMDKAPYWKVGKVSNYFNVNGEVYEPQSLQRTFTVDGTSIYDFLTKDVAEEMKCVFLFDTYNCVIHCINLEECVFDVTTRKVIDELYYSNGTYYKKDGNVKLSEEESEKYSYCEGVGKDTSVFLTRRNLLTSMSIQSNTDSIKNCFYVTGGDDEITNRVAAANTTGNNYIYNFDEFQYEDMSVELRNKLKKYQDDLAYYRDEYTRDGGVYIPDSSCSYDTVTQTCRDSMGNEVKTAVYRNGKVYVLDTCAYIKNGDSNVAFDRYDNKITDYVYIKPGVFTEYCQVLDRQNLIEHTRFPDTSLPTTNSIQQLSKIKDTLDNMEVIIKVGATETSFSNVTSAVEDVIKVMLDSRYKLKILSDVDHKPSYTKKNDSDNYGTWNGYITITKETDETDTVTSSTTISANIRKIESDNWDTDKAYIKQEMDIAISKMCIAELDFANVTDLKKFFMDYNYVTCKSYYEAFDSCIEILSREAATARDLPSNSSTYKEMFNLYNSRKQACKEVMDFKKSQLDDIQTQIDNLVAKMNDIKKKVNLKNYLGETLHNEFLSYVREDEYNNGNYISDGASDSEMTYIAQELLKVAEDELKKACKIQKTISGNLNNIFSREDLEILQQSFALYNYIRLKTDDNIYKLRLIRVDFDENSPSEIDVDFSDKIEDVNNVTNGIENAIDQVGSISTSYDSTVNQAKQGAQALSNFGIIKNNGLISADYVIKNSTNEEIVMDAYGITMRSMTEIGSYGEHQLRITGNVICFTDDAWATPPRMALGYIKINGEWQYGVVCDALVGNLICGEKLVISNNKDKDKATVVIDGNGITLTGGKITWKGDSTPVESVESYYMVTDTYEEPSADSSKWSDKIENTTDGKYLWKKTVTKYKSSEQDDTVTIECLGMTDNIASIKTQYCRHDSKENAPDENQNNEYGWKDSLDDCKDDDSKGYIWTRQVITYKSIDSDTGKPKVEIVNTVYNCEITNSENNIKDHSKFKDDVKKYLGLGTTAIGEDYVISPQIGGGYLYITSSVENDKTSVIIDPNNKKGQNYIFRVTNEAGNTVIGFDTDGNAEFRGSIEATKFKLLKDEKQYGQFDIGNWTPTGDVNRNGIGLINTLASENSYLAFGCTGINKSGDKVSDIAFYIKSDPIANDGEQDNLSHNMKIVFNSPVERLNAENLTCNGYKLVKNSSSNEVYLYWNGSSLNARVDVTELGKLHYGEDISISGTVSAGNFTCGGMNLIKQTSVVTTSGENGNHDIKIGWWHENENEHGMRVFVDATDMGNIAFENHHNIKEHVCTLTEAGNFVAPPVGNGNTFGSNIASVSWVQGKVESSDERVKTNFAELPSCIDNVFDELHPQQYEFNHILEKDGVYFGDTSQHIERVFEKNGLNAKDYAIVRKREVNQCNGEAKYITNDDYHYINQDCVLWLCVDQMQKLKKRIKELESNM